MEKDQIRSIGWLERTDGITLVACTKSNSHGFRVAVSDADFQKIRGDDDALKAKFCELFEPTDEEIQAELDATEVFETKVGNNRGKARIWIEGKRLSSHGWDQGERFDPHFEDGQIRYTRNPEGKRKVAKAGRSPVIDTNTDKITESLGDCSTVFVSFSRNEIIIKPA